MTIVQCYAPTNNHEEEDKDEFYDALNETMNKIPSHDITMVMGNVNAKIGDDNTDVEDIMGEHSIGAINNNGERLLEFCAENGLVIGGSLFPHKTIHKVTWLSPDKLTRNQIDHICIKKNFQSCLQDVKVHRGADITSDHYRCIATIKLKLKRQKIKLKPRKPDVSELKMEETKAQFNIQLRNRCVALDNIFEDPEETWEHIETIYNTVSVDVLGYSHKPTEEWITEDTWNETEQRKECKKNLLQDNNECKKTLVQENTDNKNLKMNTEKVINVKRKVRRDKKAFVDKLALSVQGSILNGRYGYEITSWQGIMADVVSSQ